jgi:cell division protein ZapA
LGQVTISIRGRSYQIACDDGQEAHLARLGRYLDQRAEQLAASGSSAGDALMLVMVGLVVADELSDTVAELESLRGAGAATARAAAENETVTAIDNIAARIERIAAGLAGS